MRESTVTSCQLDQMDAGYNPGVRPSPAAPGVDARIEALKKKVRIHGLRRSREAAEIHEVE